MCCLSVGGGGRLFFNFVDFVGFSSLIFLGFLGLFCYFGFMFLGTTLHVSL